MATATKPAQPSTPKAPEQPKPGAPATATTPPAATTPPEAPPKERNRPVLCKTAEEATKVAAGRDKGPKRAFTLKGPDGKEYHMVAFNHDQAAGALLYHTEAIGGKWTYNEIGKAPRAERAPADAAGSGIAAALKALPKDKVIEVLKAMGYDEAKINATLAELGMAS